MGTSRSTFLKQRVVCTLRLEPSKRPLGNDFSLQKILGASTGKKHARIDVPILDCSTCGHVLFQEEVIIEN